MVSGKQSVADILLPFQLESAFGRWISDLKQHLAIERWFKDHKVSDSYTILKRIAEANDEEFDKL